MKLIKNILVVLVISFFAIHPTQLPGIIVHPIDGYFDTQIDQLNDNGVIIGSKISTTYSDPYLHQVYKENGTPWYTEVRYATVKKTYTPSYWNFGSHPTPLTGTSLGAIFMNSADIILIDQAVGDVVTYTTYPDGSVEEVSRTPKKEGHIIFPDGNKITFEPASIDYVVKGFDDEGNIFFKNEKDDRTLYSQKIYNLDEITPSDLTDSQLALMNKRFVQKKKTTYTKKELTNLLNQHLIESIDVSKFTEEEWDSLDDAHRNHWTLRGWEVDEIFMANNNGQVIVDAYLWGNVPLPSYDGWTPKSAQSYYLLIDTAH